MPKKRATLPELQKAAEDYARTTFQSTPFHIQGTHEEFEATSDAILRALVRAWAAGYAAGRE